MMPDASKSIIADCEDAEARGIALTERINEAVGIRAREIERACVEYSAASEFVSEYVDDPAHTLCHVIMHALAKSTDDDLLGRIVRRAIVRTLIDDAARFQVEREMT